MRIAVYDRYWQTAGGGERYAACFAQALAGEHDVELLGHGGVDWRRLEARLGVDLSGTRQVEVDGLDETGASGPYDLVVNCSYMSAEACPAPLGVYVVLFPTAFDHDVSRKRRAATRVLGPTVRRRLASLEWGPGFHLPESGRLRRYRWTNGDASVLVRAPEGAAIPVALAFGPRPAAAGETTVEIGVDGDTVSRVAIGTGRRSVPARLAITGRGRDDPVTVTIRCDSFVPAEANGGSDRRRLGVQLRSVTAGSGLAARLAARLPWLADPPVTLDFLTTYDRVVSISRYTATWVDRQWGRESTVLFPPVPMLGPGTKGPVILAVGRFFDRAVGHSKKQLELVRAFKRLRPALHAGWELHLAGGCSPEHAAYLERVRREAEGLPVVFHVDVPGDELRELYRRASVFWHAAGLGERGERDPHRFEHFGITTVEAMSAGAVPVVFAGGGQPEIVTDGVDGFLFHSERELIERTRELVDDDALRARMGSAATDAADRFSYERFAREAREIVADLASPHPIAAQ